MGIRVVCDVPTYDESATPLLVVRSCMLRGRVELVIGDKKVTVLAAELKAAVDNATNNGGQQGGHQPAWQ